MSDPPDTWTLGPDRTGTAYRIEDGRIAEVLEGDAAAGATGDLDCSEAEIRPGWVNAHTHVYSALAPLGMPEPAEEPETFLEILERIWWRLDRANDHDTLRAGARLYAAEALLAGTTTLVDHHEGPGCIEGSLGVLADGLTGVGVRAGLTYGATERNGGLDEARRGLHECRRLVESDRGPTVRGMVGLHASFTVSDEAIRTAARLADDLRVPVHVHLAEDAADVEDARRRGWDDPLERLAELGAVPAGSILAHGVHLDADRVQRAVDLGAWFVQNPRSNHGNGVGYPSCLTATERVALGTDGYPADMEDERAFLRERMSEEGELPFLADRRLEAGWSLVEDLFGIDVAPLDEGVVADLVVRDEDGVRHAVVAGEVVVRDGELRTADIEAIREEAEEQASRLWTRMEEL